MKKRTLLSRLIGSAILGLIFLFSGISCNALSENQKRFKAFNGVEFEYSVLLPIDYQSSKAYRTVIAFAGMEPEKDLAEWSETHLWKNHQNYQSIIIVPEVPLGKEHWISHPIHHALNDFIKHIHKNYRVKDQKVHFMGYKDGCIPAQTYITMLDRNPASLILFSSQYWEHYDKATFDGLAKVNIPVKIYYSDSDNTSIFESKKVLQELQKRNVKVSLDSSNDPMNTLDRLFK